MKKLHLLILSLLILCAHFAYAEEQHPSSISIELVYPQKANSPQREIGASNTPVMVSGKVVVSIPVEPTVQDIEKDRYLVEYFLDDELIYSTKGIKDAKSASFSFILDTEKLRNGKHKMCVNFWDEKGPSAIGIKFLLVNNIPSVEEFTSEKTND